VHPQLTRKMARWAAAAALAVALIAGGIFAHRQMIASRAMRHAPPAVPPSVRQRSLQFTFSKMDGQQTVFTIHAARATQFSGGTGSLLEDVDIVVNGEHGERHDEIHTRSCEYEPKSGAIVCHGKVELDLSSVPLARPVNLPPRGGIHIAAQNVTFNRDTGTATTDAPVTFRFPQGEGSGDGAEYSSRAADFRLRRDVQLRLAAGRAGNAPTLVTAKGGLTFDRRGNQLHLLGPVGIRQGDRRIDTSELTVDLNGRLRPRRAFAGAGTFASVMQGSRRGRWQAHSAEILFDREGRARQMNAAGHVVFIGKGPAATRLQAQNVTVMLNPADGQPRTLDLKGDVRLEEKRATGVVRLKGDSLRLVMASAGGGSKAARLVEATMPDRSQAEWNSAGGDLRLTSGRLAIQFRADNQIQALRGSGGVRFERLERGQTPLVTTADDLTLHFSDGRWTRAEESGHVHATQGSRSGNADHAIWLRAKDAFELAGDARVSDPSGQLLADTIAWNRKSGQLQARGHVRLNYTANGASPMDMPGPASGSAGRMQPVNVVAEALEANSKTGQAVFSGSARLWTGNLVVQADQVELQRAKGELTATGNVRAAFPQAAFPQSPLPQTSLAAGSFGKGGNGKGSSGADTVSNASKNGAPDSTVLWRVQAKRLEYVRQGLGKSGKGDLAGSPKGGSSEVTLDGGVQAWSSQARIEAKTVVLSLRRQPDGRIGLTQAAASGGVTVRQADRRAKAENARYDAARGQFVLWGGKPSLDDAAGDLVTGSELTFSEADDTISVESSEGSRTLTRYPVRN